MKKVKSMSDEQSVKVERTEDEKTQHEMNCILSRVTRQCSSLNKLTEQFACLLNTLIYKQKDKDE